MKSAYKFVATLSVLGTMTLAEMAGLSLGLVSDAHALRGRGAAFAVGAAAGSASSSSAYANADASQQQAAAAQQQAVAAQQAAEAEKQKAIAAQQAAEVEKQKAIAAQQAATAGKPLPVGTVVSTLPAGCTPTPVGGKNYQYCGGSFYEPVYQGSTLKYTVATPK